MDRVIAQMEEYIDRKQSAGPFELRAWVRMLKEERDES